MHRGKHLRYQLTQHNTMINNELTLDQLQAVAGGATAIEYGLIATVHSRPGSQLRSKTTEAKFKNSRQKDGFRAEYDNA